jgi:hypothetical protein
MADVKRTGMIGLGAMGVQMAKHMVKKGFDVTGYNISADASKKAEGFGVRTCGSVTDAGKNAEVVFVMVANDEQIHDVIERSGLLDVLSRGSVICIASSCSPETCRDLAKLAAPKGIGIVDVPLVLGQEAMDNGQVVAYVGGSDASVAKARPAIASFSKEVLHVGDVGAGQITKSIQQHAAVGLHVREFRVSDFREKARRRREQAHRGARPRQRRQLVTVALGQEHWQMGREGHGRGARAGAGRQDADAARRPGRPAGQAPQPGAHESADVVTVTNGSPQRRA